MWQTAGKINFAYSASFDFRVAVLFAMASRRPGVGLGVFVIHPDGERILVGKRLVKDGHGQWALPGGHLEFGESFEDCAKREVLEETGLQLSDVKQVAVENVTDHNDYHYVVIFMAGRLLDPRSEARNMEPEKCEGWTWMRPADVPEPMFAPLRAVLQHGCDPTAKT